MAYGSEDIGKNYEIAESTDSDDCDIPSSNCSGKDPRYDNDEEFDDEPS